MRLLRSDDEMVHGIDDKVLRNIQNNALEYAAEQVMSHWNDSSSAENQ